MLKFQTQNSLDSSIVDWSMRWPNFSKAEMSCRHCGQLYEWPNFMDRLQALRYAMGCPLQILSAHRCSLHNAYVGGAPLSQHLKLAVDIALGQIDPGQLYHAARKHGFAGFGFYTTFLHIDLGRPRIWFGSQKAKELWQIYLD